jgi:geranylgeranyl pyrophosphate synthase
VLDGQARDLHFAAGEPSEQRVRDVACGKTVSMIRLTLLLPALASGTNLAALEDLDRLAVSWGLAYQALDDFQDVLLTSEESGKSVARDAMLARPNLVVVCGERIAIVRLTELLDDADATLAGAPSLRRRFPQLAAIQAFLEREVGAVRARIGGRTAVA